MCAWDVMEAREANLSDRSSQIPRLGRVRGTEKRQNRAKIKPGGKKDNGCSKE